MWRQRLTVFKDKPEISLLREMSTTSWRLYHVKDKAAWFLDAFAPEGAPPSLGAHYDSLIKIPDIICPEFEAFLTEHPNKFDSFQIYREILHEAIFLSQMFNTQVLSSYSDDEESDFVAVAERGELKLLRFGCYTEEIRQLTHAEAFAVDSHITAMHVSDKEIDINRIEVYEYLTYQAQKLPNTPIMLYPFHRYVEGLIGNLVVFKTLWSSSDTEPPNLIFRNAHITLRDQFAVVLPDYTADIDDFELIAQYRFRPSLRTVTAKILGDLLRFLHKRLKKHPLTILSSLMLLIIMVFGPNRALDENHSNKNSFEGSCLASGGEPRIDKSLSKITPGLGKRCVIAGLSYPEHLIPAVAGDTRVIAVHYSQAPCQADQRQDCMLLDGAEFHEVIAGFTPQPDTRGVLLLNRTTLCNKTGPAECAADAPVFHYQLQRQLLVSSGSTPKVD
ncbi:hypothetical protein [Arsukibacterium sp.]|uniref:hypothetical protein n=1 Tax=Arsukibacterium sp. TaxID=1977258 RepID=UPI002FDA5A41